MVPDIPDFCRELVAALPASGLAVLNFDDPRVRDMASLSACPVLGYAVHGEADVRAGLSELDHLATRMRRNAEDLIVLSGAEPARRWSHWIPRRGSTGCGPAAGS